MEDLNVEEMESFLEQYELALKKMGLRLDENIKERGYIEQRIRKISHDIVEMRKQIAEVNDGSETRA